MSQLRDTTACCHCGNTVGGPWGRDPRFAQCTRCYHVCDHASSDDPQDQPYRFLERDPAIADVIMSSSLRTMADPYQSGIDARGHEIDINSPEAGAWYGVPIETLPVSREDQVLVCDIWPLKQGCTCPFDDSLLEGVHLTTCRGGQLLGFDNFRRLGMHEDMTVGELRRWLLYGGRVRICQPSSSRPDEVSLDSCAYTTSAGELYRHITWEGE